jgi:phosphonatase-like hydrolase
MAIELVVFDIAGTTLKDEDSVNRCLRDALSEAGHLVTAAQVNAVMGLRKSEAIARLVEQSSGNPAAPEETDAIHRDFEARSIRFYAHDPSVCEVEGARRVFDLLRRAGIRVALNTGFNRAITQAILDRLGWMREGEVDACICSDEVPRGRPHPDMLQALMARFSIRDPLRVAKVGDTPADLLEGKNAGCGRIIGVTSGTHSRRELESYPHTHLVDSVRDVPRVIELDMAEARGELTDGAGALAASD